MKRYSVVGLIFFLLFNILPFSAFAATAPQDILMDAKFKLGKSVTDSSLGEVINSWGSRKMIPPLSYMWYELPSVANVVFYESFGPSNPEGFLLFNENDEVIYKGPSSISKLTINVLGVKKVAIYNKETSSPVPVDFFRLWVTDDDLTPPPAPKNLQVTPLNASASLSWDPSLAADLAGYNVYQNGVKINTSLVVDNRTTVASLANNTTYTFKVTAMDKSGNESLPSNEVSINFDTLPPTAPISLTAVTGSLQGTVDLTWKANSEADLAGYNLYQDGVKVNSAPLTTNSYQVSGIQANTSYTFTVTAVDASGNESAHSESVVYFNRVAPAKPTQLEAVEGNAKVDLSWNAVDNATGYNVKRSTKSGGPYTTVADNIYGNIYTDSDVINGTTYFYVVTALNKTVESEPSNEVSATPQVTSTPTLVVSIAEEKVKVGQEFTSNIALKNVKNIYAEDFTLNYNNKILEYVGFEEVPGYKIYNKPVDQNGNLRFIIASQGKEHGINDEKTFLKLKFKAKTAGTGKVDALKCRIADTEREFDLDESFCSEDSVTVEGVKDVNRSGEYTLLDLAIDGYYYGQLASNADPSKYDANQAGDEFVRDEDLVYIVNQMLLNTNYPPNK
ncbi:hypothetical protein YDYSG_18850 [Paenibacillus tyrfis]|uniref:fibronectin type III domain-containing protein n=1 Tax=Paenibacillus tyrfis TaxID=1501230 RepID=UPI002492375B|nr:fibronectin type III domain-containing protein [Paenibacillus tyrfis]GLI05855.1 hypothetical protein YDYSG_18850 [Paenibacillus tyrfis]